MAGARPADREPLRLDLTGGARRSRMRQATNFAYLLAVLAINFTLTRPSPVDILFILALLLSLVSRQVVTRNILIFIFLILTWICSLYVSSISFIDNPEVVYYMVKITFAVSIGLCSSLVAAHWTEGDLERFFKTYIASNCIAATLGIAGFVLGHEDLTWDGRAKGLLDDPNMYGAFLLPGVIACMYFLSVGRNRGRYALALAWLAFGLVLSFSRAAIVSGLVWSAIWYMFLNRRNLPRATAQAGIGIVVLAALIAIGALSVDGLAEKLADRSTVAEPYDLGYGGRYSRYALSFGFMLDHPLGMGLLEWDRYFEEPIHNILLSSFVNYGWAAGTAFTLLLMFTVAISRSNYAATRNPVALAAMVGWIAVTSCAFLHEAERWRHLWLFAGLVWGLNVRNFATLAPAAERTRSSRPAPRSYHPLPEPEPAA